MHTLTRRDIRRAVGPEALQVIQNQQQQIQVLTAQVNALTANVDKLQPAGTENVLLYNDEMRDRFRFSQRAEWAVRAICADHAERWLSWRARLRWLVTGR